MSQSHTHQSQTQVWITQLVIETTSPMAIYSGRRETGFDNELVRDANGLPMIPASAIAGVWRHLAMDAFGETTAEKSIAKQWFGDTEQAASLFISHGQLLDSQGQKVDNYTSVTELQRDPLLAMVLQARPHHRERVSINDRGVAKNTGKFDQLLLPAGMRFAVTLEWHNRPRKDGLALTESAWLALLNLWQSPYFAFGSSTRNGLGRIKLVYSDMRCFDLSQGAKVALEMQQYRNKPINQLHGLKAQLAEQKSLINRQYQVQLQALDMWRCGSGSALLGEQHVDHNVAIISYSEPRVQWTAQSAKIKDKVAMLCGSSLKGMLAHRIAFHYRCVTEQWAETMAEHTHEQWQQRPEGLKNLLGFADADDHFNSLSGALWVEDCELEFEHTQIRTHNSIDRFTGGVRQGALYSEELLYQPRMTLTLNVSRDLTQNENDQRLLQALEMTLADLELGLLPLGAGSGRGTSLVRFLGKQVMVNGIKQEELSA